MQFALCSNSLSNFEKIAQKYILVFSSYQKMTQVQFSCAKTHFLKNTYFRSKDSFSLVFFFHVLESQHRTVGCEREKQCSTRSSWLRPSKH